MNKPCHQPPRSSSTLSFGNCPLKTTSTEAVVALGVDHLPFSTRKYPATLSHELPVKKSLGNKVKDFFLNTGSSNEECTTDNSISYVEDLLKKYAEPNCLEAGICEDDSLSFGNVGICLQQGDNISYSSISNLSNATDMSSEQCAATLTSQTISQAKLTSQATTAGTSSELYWPSLNRSSSACDTCQSQDSGFVDYGSRSHHDNNMVSSEKIKGLATFITKGIFSRLKNSEPVKERPTTSSNKKKCDEFMIKATQTWLSDILPNWDRGARRWRQTHELWWLGLPPKVRGRVWGIAIGNELNISPDLYRICLDRAACVFQHLDSECSASSEISVVVGKLPQSTKSALCGLDHTASTDRPNGASLPIADKPLLQSLPSILLDLSRTFPQLGLFQHGGPLYGALKNLLSAYTSYRPDVGYVQGMSFIASMLLLNMEEFDAFVAFANMINRPLHLALFSVDRRRISAYVATFKKMLWSLMPDLAGHFAAHRLSPDVYLFEWLLPIYCRSFSLDVVSRIWDVYIRDGEHFLFKVALAILRQNEASLLASDFDQMVAILANVRAQAELTCGEQLFIHIYAVSKTRTASSEAFSKLLEESIAEDADRWCEH